MQGQLVLRRHWGRAVGAFAGPLIICALLLIVPSGLTTGSGSVAAGQSPPSLNSNWTEVFPAISPTNRAGVALAYDPISNYSVAFGGYHVKDFNQTWAFTGGSWQLLFPAASPAPRQFAAMAFDPAAGALLLFGGAAGLSRFNDTWAFSAGNWTLLHPSLSPPALAGASMAFDPGTHQMVLYGGFFANGTYSRQTWTYSGRNWALSTSSAPSGLLADGMAYDPAEHGVILVTTHNLTNSTTQTLLFKNGSWSVLNISHEPVNFESGIYYEFPDQENMVYDANHGLLLLFDWRYATWEFSHGHWLQLHPTIAPKEIFYFGMTYDASIGHVLLFGGHARHASDAKYFRDETWEY